MNAQATEVESGAAAGVDDPSVDPLFSKPYVDIDEWRDEPVRHRYIHGGFEGTDTRFSAYLPPKEQYEGRFFQYITPVPDSENLAQGDFAPEEDKIAFSIASGAYFLETNGGGNAYVGHRGATGDPTISGYRAQAAAARYSRVLAQKIYGPHRTYGYAYGGSGGAYRTLGAVENTRGVWDGSVPFVMGSAMAIPNMFTVRMHAMRILRDKFDRIVDAVDAGGSGDPYADLNKEEAAALREVTGMGFEPRSWFGHRTMGVHAFTVLYPGMVLADPGYFEDFWTKPGYLGHDHPESFAGDRLQFRTSIAAAFDADAAEAAGLGIMRIPGTARGEADTAWQVLVNDGSNRPVAYRLVATPPDVGFLGGDLVVLSGEAKGQRIGLREIKGDAIILGLADAAVLAKLKPGDEVQVDNSNFLAAQTYHRHQVPGPEYKVWDQFRDPDGKPIYPQRPVLLGPIFTANASGSVPTGEFDGKMIVVESLWDREALPWQADWYREMAKQHLGAHSGNRFRLWYTDHALHGFDLVQEDETRTTTYLPILQQALRDVSAWVEKGIEPPATTSYRLVDGQIVMPPDAKHRLGIQPVVTVSVGGGDLIEIAAGQSVEFTGTIEVPPGAGQVIGAEWDFEGKGDFPVLSDIVPGTTVTVRASHSFAEPGTYFATLRGYSQRDGDTDTPFAHIRNLGRARVVVK
ncbi:MAG: PKD domain-containing protein [Novosphingobium sp.]